MVQLKIIAMNIKNRLVTTREVAVISNLRKDFMT